MNAFVGDSLVHVRRKLCIHRQKHAVVEVGMAETLRVVKIYEI